MKLWLLPAVVFIALLVVVALTGCGGEDAPPSGTKLDLRDDATLVVEEVYVPSRDVTVQCVVVTSSSTRTRSAAVDCWWP